MRHYFLMVFLILTSQIIEAASVDKYIRKAIQSNLALQQQNFSYQKSQAVLKEARGMFLPSLAIHARYSRAGGGRSIDFPIGDLINPIHQGLNQALGQSRFPGNLSNERIPFLRKEEHETKIRLTQPLIQPKIWYNYEIKSLMEESEHNKKIIFVRDLVEDVKVAWYNYQQSAEVVKLYENTKTVLQENLRVSQKLVENNMATKDEIYTAKAELSELEHQLQEAKKNKILASQYLNFLCNQPLETEIEINTELESSPFYVSIEDAKAQALQSREELKLLELAVNITDQGINVANSDYFPTLSAVLDYGFQGEEYRFTSDDDYWMATAVLEWNLFNGWQDEAKRQQAKLDKKIYQSKKAELEQRLILQVRQAYEQWQVAQSQKKAAQEMLSSAREAFRIINKKYEQNSAAQIELIAAQNRQTRSEINYILSNYNLLIRQAELEKATASFPVDELKTFEEE